MKTKLIGMPSKILTELKEEIQFCTINDIEKLNSVIEWLKQYGM